MQQKCNDYCFKKIGTICRADVENNLEWPTSRANESVKLPCLNSSSNKYHAYRMCMFEPQNMNFIQLSGVWSTPNINECIEQRLLTLKNEVC